MGWRGRCHATMGEVCICYPGSGLAERPGIVRSFCVAWRELLLDDVEWPLVALFGDASDIFAEDAGADELQAADPHHET